jgi:hypothetical protein
LLLLVVQGTSLTVKAQTTISLVGSNVVLNFPTASNLLYSVQRKDVLASNTWSTIASNMVGSGGIRTNIDTGAATVVSRFYRVGSFNPSTNGGTVAVQVQFTGGEPVQGALVILSYSGVGQYGYTDNNGQIIFANVHVGSFTIQAYSPDDGVVVANGSGNVAGPGSLASTMLTLLGTGSVEVWVDYDSGDPAVMASVNIISGTSTNGPGYTDSAGHLTSQGIPVGSFSVTVYNPTNMTSFVTGSGNLATNGASATLYLNLP